MDKQIFFTGPQSVKNKPDFAKTPIQSRCNGQVVPGELVFPIVRSHPTCTEDGFAYIYPNQLPAYDEVL